MNFPSDSSRASRAASGSATPASSSSFINSRDGATPQSTPPTARPCTRRRSSGALYNSPFGQRRRSFLSESMLEHEVHAVYPMTSMSVLSPSGTYTTIPVYSLSLKESQGFQWNQDLFTPRMTDEPSESQYSKPEVLDVFLDEDEDSEYLDIFPTD